MKPLSGLIKKAPLEFAKTMIKKQFPVLAESEFEIEEQKAECPDCKKQVVPEYWIKREQDTDFRKVPMDPMPCLPCQNKKLGIESVERSKRLKSEYFTNQFWNVPPELADATLKNYAPADGEQAKALQRAINYLQDYKKGERYNLMLRGTYGGGKSHLLKGIAEAIKKTTKVDEDGHNVPVTVGFLGFDELLNMVKGTWGRREGQTEAEILKMAVELDFLVIDDLGTESGEWSGRKLFEIINGRQGKPTAYTTNFMDMKELAKRFDINGGKIISRLHNNMEIVDVVTKDMRIEKGRGSY